jgi:hypothetical protein
MACIVVVDASITLWIERGMKDGRDWILGEASAYLKQGFAA